MNLFAPIISAFSLRLIMKITKQRLKKIIREELSKANEAVSSRFPGDTRFHGAADDLAGRVGKGLSQTRGGHKIPEWNRRIKLINRAMNMVFEELSVMHHDISPSKELFSFIKHFQRKIEKNTELNLTEYQGELRDKADQVEEVMNLAKNTKYLWLSYIHRYLSGLSIDIFFMDWERIEKAFGHFIGMHIIKIVENTVTMMKII